MKTVIRIGEYFCGPGGMALGAIGVEGSIAPNLNKGDAVQFESVFAVDYHHDACQTYLKNIHHFNSGFAQFASTEDGEKCEEIPGVDVPQGEYPLVLHADVAKVQPELLGDIDGFVFGFPCNDFSMAGEKKGLKGSFGLLYRYGIELIDKKLPKFFVAENVSGILNANDWSAFKQVMDELRASGAEAGGYEVVPHLYKFEEYGVPQTRHRVIIVGIRRDLVEMGVSFRPPAPTNETVTAREALEGIFEAGPLTEGNPDGYPNNFPKKLTDIVRQRIELTPPGKNIWDVNDNLPQKLRLNVQSAKMSSIYKVIDPDKPSYTVVGSGGGGTHMYHWDKRATTDRERAALQTFPNDYAFVGNMGSVRRQIGMAVPPVGARVIFTAVAKTLLGIEYDAVEPNLSKVEDASYIEKKIKNRELAKIRRAAKEAEELKKKLAKEAEEMAMNEQSLRIDTISERELDSSTAG